MLPIKSSYNFDNGNPPAEKIAKRCDRAIPFVNIAEKTCMHYITEYCSAEKRYVDYLWQRKSWNLTDKSRRISCLNCVLLAKGKRNRSRSKIME